METHVELQIADTQDHRARQLADALQSLVYPDYLPDGKAERPPKVHVTVGRNSVEGRVKDATIRYDSRGVIKARLTIES